MKIYIVHSDIAFDYETESEIMPFRNKQDAVDKFNELHDQYKKEAEDAEMVIEDDTDEHFEAYEDGYASCNHYYLTLSEHEI